MRISSLLIFTALAFSLAGCLTVPSASERLSTADTIMQEAGFHRSLVGAGSFLLTAYSRIQNPGQPLHIYIEGDGYAWVTRNRVSGDPTPLRPVALELAAKDPASNVIYLARPCQYTPMEMNPLCEEAYWTGKRFSEEVINSMDQAVDKFAKAAGSPGIYLIGYSGGAAVAILVAARRQDIRSLRTIAGNLDPEVVNQYHGVTPLDGSLNPAEVANKIVSIPQIHFVGGEDSVIPFSAVSSYLKKMGDGRCFQTKTLPEATHTKGWVENWAFLLSSPISCRES